MANAVLLPKLGQTVEEATIVKWHKKEGDKVEKGEVLFEIETDKAVLEAESFHSGALLKILVAEQETVPVSTVVAYVGKPGEKPPAAPAAQPPAPAETMQAPRGAEDRGAKTEDAGRKKEATPVTPPPSVQAGVFRISQTDTPARLLISPRAKALAKAKTVDPADIKGTGPNGRVVEKDVLTHLKAHHYDDIRITPTAKRLSSQNDIDILNVKATGTSNRITVNDVRRAIAEKPRPMTRMRQVIARRLTQSFTTTPHFYLTVSTDMTDLLAFRQKLKAKGGVYTVTDFILEAVILSLAEFPVLSSVTDGTTVRWHGDIDLGMAVGLEDGLVVPVIRDAASLSMPELHVAAQTLSAKAHDGKLLPDDMTGSTFTVSNMGMLDVENFAAIINPGESAILAVSSTLQKAAVVNGRVVIRSLMKMTLSSDHRIVDGTVGAAFTNSVKSKLEDIGLWKSLT